LDKIHLHGKNALAKMDIKSAFRLLNIHSADFDLMGIKFGGSYYIDKCLPMGCSVSCKLFETFSTFLQWSWKEEQIQNQLITIWTILFLWVLPIQEIVQC
jgi:hypothetical protein